MQTAIHSGDRGACLLTPNRLRERVAEADRASRAVVAKRPPVQGEVRALSREVGNVDAGVTRIESFLMGRDK